MDLHFDQISVFIKSNTKAISHQMHALELLQRNSKTSTLPLPPNRNIFVFFRSS